MKQWAVLIAAVAIAAGQSAQPSKNATSAEQKPPDPAPAVLDSQSKRIELNLLGKTDTASGESRRNENIQFNLVDNNALKELNIRLGTNATIHEFRPERGYFGAEFGTPPSAVLHVAPLSRTLAGTHGALYWNHQNSVFAARSFFQVGGVKPAHDNDYGFNVARPLWRGAHLTLSGSQQRMRGQVNGNVLVPQPDERTALAADPRVRTLINGWLLAYPSDLPNRTDVNPRALNRSAPQHIDGNNATIRLDQAAGAKDRTIFSYNHTSQFVQAFQLVAGQNPDTDTRSHTARITWNRVWDSNTTTDFSTGFDRIGSFLHPEPNAIGPMVSVSGLETLGPQAIIPINRAQNLFKQAGIIRRIAGRHQWTAGFQVLRRQLNGSETDCHRGFFGFSNDFGRTAIENFRLGLPSQYIISIGDVHRGFRSWEGQVFAGDNWNVTPNLSVQYGVRWTPVSRPYEVNGRNTIAYSPQMKNFGPTFGFAYRLPGQLGIVRSAYGLHFGEIFPVTFQQVRLSPPGSTKMMVPVPDLLDPLGHVADAKGNLYLLDPRLATPYSHQYNFSWEPDPWSKWKVQLGYVGSRSHRLLVMWYLNRGHVAPGIPQTTATLNQRRPDPEHAETRLVVNGSRGYFDAFRAALVVPRWRGLSLDAAYWFSKAMDLGASYTNTAYDVDSRISRSQSEYETQHDMKGRSSFDQPHAFLVRGAYLAPRRMGHWNLSAVALLKSGSPFTVAAGSDAPGYGNVDGNGGDRPNLLDPSILGRTVGNPDTSRAMLPRSAFAFMQPTDDGGNLGRNTFRRGGYRNVNASLSREWILKHETRMTLRAESINLFNTPQFAEPGTDLANANFGQITNTLNDGRTFRFGVQFGW